MVGQVVTARTIAAADQSLVRATGYVEECCVDGRLTDQRVAEYALSCVEPALVPQCGICKASSVGRVCVVDNGPIEKICCVGGRYNHTFTMAVCRATDIDFWLQIIDKECLKLLARSDRIDE